MDKSDISTSALQHFGDLGFQRLRPCHTLQDYITWFWCVDAAKGEYIPRKEFMHADGSTGIVFNWSDELNLNEGKYRKGVNIIGPTGRSKSLHFEGNLSSFGILFRPGVISSFFSPPGSEILSLDSLNLQEAQLLGDLFEALGESQGFIQRVVLCEAFLKKRLIDTQRGISLKVQHGIDMIQRYQGTCSLEALSKALNVSVRQTERLFQQHVGLSPKKYLRTAKVSCARGLIKQGHIQSLADIAVSSGFYDQSHLNRDFTQVVGLTPGQYRKIKRQL